MYQNILIYLNPLPVDPLTGVRRQQRTGCHADE